MITCPYCHKDFDFREAIIEKSWKDIIDVVVDCSPHGSLMFEYVMKFGVESLRIKPVKALRLLQEVRRVYKDEKFTYRRRVYKISSRGVGEALRVVCNKQFDPPLGDHNYLKAVMIKIAEKEEKARVKRLDERHRKMERYGRESLAEVTESTEGFTTLGDFLKKEGLSG